MGKHSVGIFTFGITVLEAFHVGLPCIVISHSKENDAFAKITTRHDCMKYLGYYKEIDFNKLPAIVFSFLNLSCPF